MAEFAQTPITPKDIPPDHQQTDMEMLVGYILMIGVLLSLLLILAGVAWNWVQTGTLGISYGIQGMNLFQFVGHDVHRLIVGGLKPSSLINWGIAVLLLTPYIRVFASMLYFFFVEHNWKYSIFTAFVFSVLTYSLFLR